MSDPCYACTSRGLISDLYGNESAVHLPVPLRNACTKALRVHEEGSKLGGVDAIRPSVGVRGVAEIRDIHSDQVVEAEYAHRHSKLHQNAAEEFVRYLRPSMRDEYSKYRSMR